ncbi:trypco2 family protein [Streptomyces sp. CG1]|uniref:trypco2 family protein n=1 Tax=Streptomyces sp. CG1 TaxID=1287523 RepID=UPI0034E2520A
MDETELSEAVKAVRAGLTAAQQDGADAAIRFTVKEIVLDLGIEIRKTAAASGGVKAFVVSGESQFPNLLPQVEPCDAARGTALTAPTGPGR